MIPDPAAIPVEQVPQTVLFPGDETDRIFGLGDDGHAPPLFRPMWEYAGRRDYSYIFMTPELLSLLHTLKEQGTVRGVQAEFGCSPWPATNIWFESPGDASLPNEVKHAMSDTYWAGSYAPEFDAVRAAQSAHPSENEDITRLLVDCHFRVHQLACELPDRPVTAEMDLRAFNNPADAVDGPSGAVSAHDIGYRMGANPETMDRLRRLNELSFESARRRLAERRKAPSESGRPFIDGAILTSLFNYIPWKAFLKKLDRHLLPGGLLVLYNAQEGERAHLDWRNIADDQGSISAFIQDTLGYIPRIHELRNAGSPVTPLYLVAQKK